MASDSPTRLILDIGVRSEVLPRPLSGSIIGDSSVACDRPGDQGKSLQASL